MAKTIIKRRERVQILKGIKNALCRKCSLARKTFKHKNPLDCPGCKKSRERLEAMKRELGWE